MPLEPDTRSPFLPTRWSLVDRVRKGGADATAALEELCRAYWFPLYGWARRSGRSPADSEDAVQGFFSDVVRKQLFARAEEAKGRLRTFLLTAFRRYQRDLYDKANAEQRGAHRLVSFDAMAGEESSRGGGRGRHARGVLRSAMGPDRPRVGDYPAGGGIYQARQTRRF